MQAEPIDGYEADKNNIRKEGEALWQKN